MEKNDLLELAREERGYAFGGREVLRVAFDMPHGTCRAAVHFEKLLALWATFAEQELFPDAAREWEQKARAGEGFAFRPHAARGEIRTYPTKRGLKIELLAILSVGGEVRFSRTLSTLWDRTGTRQYKRGARVGGT